MIIHSLLFQSIMMWLWLTVSKALTKSTKTSHKGGCSHFALRIRSCNSFK